MKQITKPGNRNKSTRESKWGAKPLQSNLRLNVPSPAPLDGGIEPEILLGGRSHLSRWGEGQRSCTRSSLQRSAEIVNCRILRFVYEILSNFF